MSTAQTIDLPTDPDAARWARVLARDPRSDGEFVTAVVSTGIYCRPSCPARHPRRHNVRFYDLPREAEAAGFRACLRCKPREPSPHQRAALAVDAACRTLEAAATAPSLAALAVPSGLSRHHFHRVFKAHTGVTPQDYFHATRARRAAIALADGDAPAAAAYGAGFGSLSRFYDTAAARFGMTPSALRAGGAGEVIVVAQGPSRLGIVTVAFSRRGIAAVRLSDTATEGRTSLDALYRNALTVDGGPEFEALLAEVVALVDEPALAAELPLDIRGTAFEERVWAALRQIPVGTTATYGEIAAALGAPAAHRAVARACASNRIAVIIPCHRVVRADGSLAGYRWGVERKRALLRAELAAAADAFALAGAAPRG